MNKRIIAAIVLSLSVSSAAFLLCCYHAFDSFFISPSDETFETELFGGRTVTFCKSGGKGGFHSPMTAELSVKVGGWTVFSLRAENDIANYDYQNDFEDHFKDIITKYEKDGIFAYEFNWGIIYSLDRGETVRGVAKSDYIYMREHSDEFSKVYHKLSVTKRENEKILKSVWASAVIVIIVISAALIKRRINTRNSYDSEIERKGKI